MAADGRFGGHIVAGHVDGVGTVQRDPPGMTTLSGTPSPPGRRFLRYVVEKGSITIDGISLTVAKRGRTSSFAISAIPHTVAVTMLADRKGAEIRSTWKRTSSEKYVDKAAAASPRKPLRKVRAERLAPPGITQRILELASGFVSQERMHCT